MRESLVGEGMGSIHHGLSIMRFTGFNEDNLSNTHEILRSRSRLPCASLSSINSETPGRSRVRPPCSPTPILGEHPRFRNGSAREFTIERPSLLLNTINTIRDVLLCLNITPAHSPSEAIAKRGSSGRRPLGGRLAGFFFRPLSLDIAFYRL